MDWSAVRGAGVLCLGGSCGTVDRASGVDVVSGGDIAGSMVARPKLKPSRDELGKTSLASPWFAIIMPLQLDL